MKKIAILLFLTAVLWGCAAQAPEVTEPSATPTTIQTEVPTVPKAEAQAFMEAPKPAAAFVPEAEHPGTLEVRGADGVIDFSCKEDGYVMALYEVPCELRLKVLVKGPQTTYSFNLTPEQWTVFPLSDGNGSYQVGIYQQVDGSKYASVVSADFDVVLTDEFAPFLRPNQYVNYTEATQAVAKGLELTQGLTDPLDKVEAVYHFVVGTLEYDYEKAQTVTSGYIPVLDQVLEAEKGICFDYAALMSAMLRSQQIPCKLVVGYAGETYHAWISVWTEEHGWIDGIIFFDGQRWKRMDPTFASSGADDPDIMDFIEHGSYTVKYLY